MIELDVNKCTGCSICIKICPQGVFLLNSQTARIAFEDRCVECAACQLNCPEDAIKVTKGTGCLVAIIQEDILKTKKPGCG